MLDGTLVHWTRLSTPEERKRQWLEASPQERVKLLVALLRDLPPEHEWDYRFVGGPGLAINRDGDLCRRPYGHCGSAGCARGAALLTYGHAITDPDLGMNRSDYRVIFYGTELASTRDWPHVTPHDVADALERWAATGEARLVPTGGGR